MKAEREEHYLKETYRYLDLMTKNLGQQDTATLQVSIAIVAALTALGRDIIDDDKVLSLFILFFFFVTIACVIFGYWVSNQFCKYCINKLKENYLSGGPLSKDLDNNYGTIANLMNHVQPITFFIALLLTSILVTKYVVGI